MKLCYEGHACFQLENAQGVKILIDPFITHNPSCKKSWKDFNPEIILVTHGHMDHMEDTLTIARNSGATLVSISDLIYSLDCDGIKTEGINMGGTVVVKSVAITMVPAWHGSSSFSKGGVYGGLACGFVIRTDGLCIYHAGDTALFGDMNAVISRYNIDYALLPIGDYFTMGPEDAVVAAEWLKAKTVIPMHYNTFPVIKQDVNQFKENLENNTQSKCLILNSNDTIEI